LLCRDDTQSFLIHKKKEKKIPSESFNCINKELEPIKGIEEEEEEEEEKSN